VYGRSNFSPLEARLGFLSDWLLPRHTRSLWNENSLSSIVTCFTDPKTSSHGETYQLISPPAELSRAGTDKLEHGESCICRSCLRDTNQPDVRSLQPAEAFSLRPFIYQCAGWWGTEKQPAKPPSRKRGQGLLPGEANSDPSEVPRPSCGTHTHAQNFFCVFLLLLLLLLCGKDTQRTQDSARSRSSSLPRTLRLCFPGPTRA